MAYCIILTARIVRSHNCQNVLAFPLIPKLHLLNGKRAPARELMGVPRPLPQSAPIHSITEFRLQAPGWAPL